MSICPRIRDRRRIRPAAEARVGQETEAQNDLRSSYISLYRLESDEQIYQRLRCLAAELGRPPNKADVPGFDYIKSRLGSWPRILEQAGIKPVRRLGQKARAAGKGIPEEEAVANGKPR